VTRNSRCGFGRSVATSCRSKLAISSNLSSSGLASELGIQWASVLWNVSHFSAYKGASDVQSNTLDKMVSQFASHGYAVNQGPSHMPVFLPCGGFLAFSNSFGVARLRRLTNPCRRSLASNPGPPQKGRQAQNR